ncbi:MAG: hypothetical protein ACP5KN_07785 [Armatimonadota bacterium]
MVVGDSPGDTKPPDAEQHGTPTIDEAELRQMLQASEDEGPVGGLPGRSD